MVTENWAKSTYSTNPSGCVACRLHGGMVQVRDDKDPHGPVLVFTPEAWAQLLLKVKRAQ